MWQQPSSLEVLKKNGQDEAEKVQQEGIRML
jgi:hypothetical protein